MYYLDTTHHSRLTTHHSPLRHDSKHLVSRYNAVMPEPLCCPYCNAYVAVPAGTVEDGQRLLCSRCGETFTFRGFPREAITETPTAFTAHSLPVDAPTPEFIRRPWSNRAIAGIIFGGMAAMAVVGVLISLGTQSVRRE